MTASQLFEQLASLSQAAAAWLYAVLSAWQTLAQVAGIALAAIAALFLHRALHRRMNEGLSRIPLLSGLPVLRGALARQTGMIAFLFAAWIAIAATPDAGGRIYTGVIEIVASLLTAWVLITLTSSFIGNRFLARLVAALAWLLAALNILDLLTPAMAVLENVTFSIGGNTLSLLGLINGVVILVILLWIAGLLSRWVERLLADASDLSPRGRVLISKSVRVFTVILAIMIALPTVGINFAALAVFTGALGVGIGIGLQKQVSNLVSGVFLLLDKSIKPGDVIEVGQSFGWVKEMTARYVGVITRDNKEILIPNDEFVVNRVINWSHSDRSVRMEITFGVSYGADPHKVRELAVAAAKQPGRVAAEPEPVCHVIAFGDSSVDFTLRFWIHDPENGVTNVKGQVFLALWDLFKTNGIEIPFPRRHVILDPASAAALREPA